MIDYLQDEWVVEPGNVSIIHCITSINLANISRRKCDNSLQGVLVNKEGLVGDIKLIPGFNCSITDRNNIFTINSVLGGGACLTEAYCGASKVPMTEDEEQQLLIEDSLDGCTLCDETIKAINGINDKSITIQGGPGITIKTEEDTIVIKLEKQQFNNGCNKDL